VDQLEEIKSKIDIVDFISKHITLKKAGRNFKALCPFHKEKTPSFVISPERQIFKCFGCSAGGDVFKFMMLFNGLSFGEAVRELAKRAGVTLRRFRPSEDYEEKEKLLAINHLAAEYYHFVLTKHAVGKKALTYLLKRGIKKKTIEEFGLGYAPDSWETLLSFLMDKKKHGLDELSKAGLVIKTGRGKRGGYARFRGRVMFPLKDLQGNVVGFSGRVLEKDEEGAKYINTPETLLYHKSKLLYSIWHSKQAIREKKTAILVEGEFDVLSSWQMGISNVVAIKGSALTQEQAKIISRFAESLTFCLDADKAGDEATRRGIEVAEETGLNLNVIRFSEGKDVDELISRDPKKWREAIKRPISIYDFYLKSALKRFDKTTPLGKRKISGEMVPLFAKIGNEVVRGHFIKKTARVLGVSEEAVFEEIEKFLRTGRVKDSDRDSDRDGKSVWDKMSRREKLEHYLLSLIIQSDEPEHFLRLADFKVLGNKGILKIFEGLKKALSRKNFNMVKWSKKLPEELAQIFDLAFLVELPGLSDDKREKEIKRAGEELEKLGLRDKLAELREKLGEAEEKGEEKKVERLTKEVSKTLREMSSKVQ